MRRPPHGVARTDDALEVLLICDTLTSHLVRCESPLPSETLPSGRQTIMAETVDANNMPPPIKHKALLNVDMGEGVSVAIIAATIADAVSTVTSNVVLMMKSCH